MVWTSLSAETDLVDSLRDSERVEVSMVGESVNGHPIRVIRIGIPPKSLNDRHALVMTGCVHGSEPAGREALLSLAQRLESTTDADELAFLEQYGVALIPTVNPDGFNEISQPNDDHTGRRNARDVDLNRDALHLGEPESQAVAFVLAGLRPTVFQDLHEYLPDPDDELDVQVGAGLAVQAHHRITDASMVLRDHLISHAQGQSWDADRWGSNVRGDINLLDISAGLRHAVSGIVESNRIDDSTSGREHRRDINDFLVEALLTYTRENIDRLDRDREQAVVEKVREGAEGREVFNLRGESPLDPPPLGYRLDGPLEKHRQGFNIEVEGDTVSMAQMAQPVIPYLLDPSSENAVVSAERLFDAGDVDRRDPQRPRVAEAVPTLAVTWYACDLVTGRVIAELPDLQGNVKRVIGEYESASFTLPIPLSGPATIPIQLALQSTEPGTTMLVPEINGVPSAGFIVMERSGGTEATLELACVSLEGYLDRRFVRDHRWDQRDEASVIAAGLVNDAQVEGIDLTIDAPSTGTRRDREYEDEDDATVYSRLQELMEVEDGPEWTIDVDWTSKAKTAITKIFRVRKRIGRDRPDVVIDTRGPSDASYTYTESYTDGRGANHILATSTGEGDEDRPESDAMHDVRTGWPRYEARISPSTSIERKSILDGHARSELELRWRGSKVFDLQTRWASRPMLNVDWELGDTIHWELIGHRHPEGITSEGRVIGWDLDMQAGTVTPILWDEAE